VNSAMCLALNSNENTEIISLISVIFSAFFPHIVDISPDNLFRLTSFQLLKSINYFR
jgi:hypothetical protein